MNWTAIVPFNFGRPRKTRLSGILSEGERDLLAIAMARHVVDTLMATPGIAAILLLAPVDPTLAGARWIRDAGRGLNAELGAARDALPGQPVLFIHADLPLLRSAEVSMLLDAAGTGVAIAPDAASLGTNAIALADDRPFLPAFGADSLAAHRRLLPAASLVMPMGLIHDVDDAQSLRFAAANGFIPPA